MLTRKTAKRLVVFIVGMTVLLFGLALLVLPGPAVVVIPIGLAILATEFVWAQRLIKRVKEGVRAFPLIGSQERPPDEQATAPPSAEADPLAGSRPASSTDQRPDVRVGAAEEVVPGQVNPLQQPAPGPADKA